LFAFWHALIALFHALTLRYWVWKILAPINKPKPAWSNVSQNSGFIYQVWRINLLNMALTSGDKLLLARILTLKQFGYYALAWSLAVGIFRIIMPFYNTFYPHFCQLVAQKEGEKLTELYRLASQFLAIALVPVCLTLAFFSYEVLYLWTQDSELANRLQWVLSILVIAMLFRGLQILPYAAQLAYGWTRLIFGFYAVAVLLMIPALLLFNHFWGLIGVASFFLLSELCYVTVVIPLFYRRYFNDLKWWWYRRAFLQPVLFTLVVVLSGRWYVNGVSNVWGQIGVVIGSYVLSVIVVALLFPDIRNYLRGQLSRYG
jgi:O-antigen/teichoic acid export membrane protein